MNRLRTLKKTKTNFNKTSLKPMFKGILYVYIIGPIDKGSHHYAN